MFTKLVEKRRSVREFSDQKVEKEKIDSILEAALRAPSGRALRPWEFVVVSDRELLENLSVAKPGGAEFIKDVSVAIVICADTSESGVWIEDCAIAAVSMQYAAHSLGLGSRWSQMRNNNFSDNQSTKEYIAGLLDLPGDLEVECIIGIGYSNEQTVPYTKEDLPFEKISYNRYGQR